MNTRNDLILSRKRVLAGEPLFKVIEGSDDQFWALAPHLPARYRDPTGYGDDIPDLYGFAEHHDEAAVLDLLDRAIAAPEPPDRPSLWSRFLAALPTRP